MKGGYRKHMCHSLYVHFCIKNVRIENGTYVFDLVTPKATLNDVRFGKPGRHNLLNGLVAFAMALESGADITILANALASFKGVKRRFSYKIKTEELIFIDDYAHHPTEIDAIFNAISEMHPNKKVLAIFQPHLFSRTRDFIDEFAKSLSQFSNVLLLDIYPARELPIAGVDSEWLLGKMSSVNRKKVNKDELITEIINQNPEVLVTMGAGDIGLEVERIQKRLAYAN
jgi:UDP-N-acetylmuramate--alanine ligase